MGTRDFKLIFALDEVGKPNLGERQTSLPFRRLLFIPENVPVHRLPTKTLVNSETPWYYPIGIANGSLFLGWTDGGNVRFLEGISPEAVRGIRHGKGRVLLVNHLEGDVMDDETIRCLHQAADDYDIPREKIVLVTGNLLAENHYESWNRRNPGHDRIHVVSFDAFQAITHRIATKEDHRDKDLVDHEEWLRTRDKIRGKKFLMFNRRPHAHRILAITELFRENLLQHGHVSLPGDVRRADWRPRDCSSFSWTRDGELCYERHIDCFVDIPSALQAKLPLTVDVDEFDTNHAATWNAWPYFDSYLNVVGETRIDNVLFLTEKVYKPILNYQPFVVIGSRNTLRYLRQQGYKTFDLDESYDEVRDQTVRVFKAIQQVKKIARMHPSELHDWYWKQQETLEHNRRVLLGKENINMTLVARLWKILHS